MRIAFIFAVFCLVATTTPSQAQVALDNCDAIKEVTPRLACLYKNEVTLKGAIETLQKAKPDTNVLRSGDAVSLQEGYSGKCIGIDGNSKCDVSNPSAVSNGFG